ncbi:5-methylthioadenosine/S-adenosylhomocysteine deaminase [Desulfocicer vacuolatum DSM 3385]|uniref:5-methylthioadenosine/S-adenosylhomocysteine deaminase n=1 Tax=Desulfocicer vacuolatum DSM 3385 TaxID=1121400 RepID=A0A1W2A4J2_9BACT|nr:amidohydrolase [Desulfocicer vacuolatum]SMC55595.1 5-methylthioadenosine/S-adenosylhomocysteine deaminase [Desulfocicer vacuolatum DSM 3385]
MDLLIKNGMILTMNAGLEVIEKGAVRVRDGIIISVGKDDMEPSQEVPTREIDAHGGIIMPGLINSHTHAAMTLFRGLADDLPLMEWLNDHIFPAEAKITADMVYRGTLLACAEMLLSGTTCFCDMYLFEEEVAKAASKAGMRAVVGEVLYDFPSPCYGPLDKGFEYVKTMMEKWKAHPLITVAVEPHATYTCAPELLTRAADMARTRQVPLVIHVAETRNEVKLIKEKYGKTPVNFLADLGILGPNVVACHSVHLTPEERAVYRKFDVKVAHCPESNMKLASGVAPVPEFLSEGICVALGTDGCASNNDLDLFQEMDSAAKLHKVFSMNPEAVDAASAVKMATINGARALGLDESVGSLEPGKKADIIVVDTRSPHMVPMYNPYSQLVYAAKGSDVMLSIVDGKVLMENQALTTLDVDQVMDDVLAMAKKIAAGDGG